MSTPRPGTLALIFVSLPVLVGIIVYGPFALDLLLHRRPPSRFLIPSGYVGWVRIEYNVSGAPPLSREGKYRRVWLQKDGTLTTSSDLPEGWGRDQFFYYAGSARHPLSNAGWCKGGMIWNEETGSDNRSSRFQRFFVGTQDQFRAEIDPTGNMHSPCG